MAVTENILMQGMSGGFAKQMVFKHYAYGTVVTRYPDMAGIKPSGAQKKRRGLFLEAVKYAQDIVGDKVKKAEWQKRIGKGKSVYHAAIKEYLSSR